MDVNVIVMVIVVILVTVVGITNVVSLIVSHQGSVIVI